MQSTIKAILLMFVLVLAGCGTMGLQTNVVYKTEVIAPEDSLLLDCDVMSPPEREAYIAATMKEREKMLVNFSMKQMENLFVCNKRFKALRDWKKEKIEALSKTTELK